ncbi:MAG: hypothetical protein V4538_06900 [Bacteroidota bacterium]
MQTQKPNQKDDQRKQNDRDVSGQSKNLNTKNESGLKKDAEVDSKVDKNASTKNPSKSSPTHRDR